jgi:hypothetical protein
MGQFSDISASAGIVFDVFGKDHVWAVLFAGGVPTYGTGHRHIVANMPRALIVAAAPPP